MLGYTVTGTGAFPLDMLRYDCSWPSRGQDVTAILRSAGHAGDYPQRWTIRLNTHKHTVSEARWMSFGWTVGYDR